MSSMMLRLEIRRRCCKNAGDFIAEETASKDSQGSSEARSKIASKHVNSPTVVCNSVKLEAKMTSERPSIANNQ